jgi:hypothetical protein
MQIVHDKEKCGETFPWRTACCAQVSRILGNALRRAAPVLAVTGGSRFQSLVMSVLERKRRKRGPLFPSQPP